MNSARKKVGLYRKKYLLIERAENGLVGNLKSCKITGRLLLGIRNLASDTPLCL